MLRNLRISLSPVTSQATSGQRWNLIHRGNTRAVIGGVEILTRELFTAVADVGNLSRLYSLLSTVYDESKRLTLNQLHSNAT